MKLTEFRPSLLNVTVTHRDRFRKKAVKELGTKALDERSVLATELKQERRELNEVLGGPSEISSQEMAIIEMIAMKRIRRKPIQEWALLNRDALFNRRNKCLALSPFSLNNLKSPKFDC